MAGLIPGSCAVTAFAGKRVVVMGLGRFGGGIGVARWLCEQGARVLVTDLSTEAALAQSMASLDGLGLDYRLGGHAAADLDGCDLIVVSPAVDKRKSDFFQTAVEKGIAWTTEMTLFLERCCAKIVGITGTAGKSTTTAMVGAILEAAQHASGWRYRRVWLGGNIGRSLLADLAGMTPDDVVVLELSSFQLEDVARLSRSPDLALVTNVRDNHLDRHGNLQTYAAAKGNIYRFQPRHGWLALPFDEGVDLLPGGWEDKPRLYRFGADRDTGKARIGCRNNTRSETELVAMPLKVPGLHNVHNAAGALAISRMLGVADAVALPALGAFGGLPHRLEFVREYQGVRYYNDSKATSPEAAMTSLRAFDCPVVMLLGGSDKGSSFGSFAEGLIKNAKAVVCMGQTGPAIAAAMRKAATRQESTPLRPALCRSAEDLAEAVKAAQGMAEPGDVVLLSPACASFDWFSNYEERGERFKRIVMGWTP